MATDEERHGFPKASPLSPNNARPHQVRHEIAMIKKSVEADLEKLLTDPDMRMHMVAGLVRL